MIFFALTTIWLREDGKKLKVEPLNWTGFPLEVLIIVADFLMAGLHITKADFASYFHWPIFAASELLAITVFAKCLRKPK